MRQSLDSGVPVGATADRPQPLLSRATADEDSRWGVAVGILNTEDCGEEGNP